MSILRNRLNKLKVMREEDRELLRCLKDNAPEGVDLEARAQSLKQLEEAARIDDGVIRELENAVTAHETTILERFGYVLGWTANMIAASAIGFTLWLIVRDKIPNTIELAIVGGGIAAVVYGIGRALRYIFAGGR